MNDDTKNYAGLPVKYVVAGNYGEYKAYIKHKPRIEFYYRYVDSIDILRGLSDIDGFYYGTYESRHDINEIRAAIAIIKARKVWGDPKPAVYQWVDDSSAVGVVAQEIGEISPDFFRAINGGDLEEYINRRVDEYKYDWNKVTKECE